MNIRHSPDGWIESDHFSISPSDFVYQVERDEFGKTLSCTSMGFASSSLASLDDLEAELAAILARWREKDSADDLRREAQRDWERSRLA